MEVIKHGNTYGAPQEKSCSNCGCVFTYVEKDIKTVLGFWGEDDIKYTYINCPECGKTIIIKDFRK